MKKTPFKILGIEQKKYSDEELKEIYLKLIRLNPPEKSPEKFKEIRRAYDQIRNAKSPYDFLKLCEVYLFDKCLSEEELKNEFEKTLCVGNINLDQKRKILLKELGGQA